MDVLLQLAEGMVFDRPAFRPLFDAVEAQLEKLVSTQRSEADASIALLTEPRLQVKHATQEILLTPKPRTPQCR